MYVTCRKKKYDENYKKNNTSLKIQTHAKHFIFQKAGYILSKKEYNAELERKKQSTDENYIKAVMLMKLNTPAKIRPVAIWFLNPIKRNLHISEKQPISIWDLEIISVQIILRMPLKTEEGLKFSFVRPLKNLVRDRLKRWWLAIYGIKIFGIVFNKPRYLRTLYLRKSPE